MLLKGTKIDVFRKVNILLLKVDLYQLFYLKRV